VGTDDASVQTAMVTRGSRRRSALPRRDRRAGRGRTLGILAVVVCAALLVTAFAWWLGTGGKTNVPAVIKMTEGAATRAVQDAGLKVEVGEPVFSEDVQAGLVAASEPRPGTRVDRGSAVILRLSKGPERYEVPALAGKTTAEAEQKLAAVNLKVGTITRKYSAGVAKNRVISTDPPAGEQVSRGTAIALVLSRGPQLVHVPQVTGRPVEEATRTLEQAGFRVATRTTASNQVAKDLVVAQDPNGGTAPRGSTVELTVSAGPPLVQVPDVRNKKVRQAQQILEKAGFQVSILRLPGGPGNVLAQYPSPGTEVQKGSVVRLSVF
jgi:serine/threonine-protein kinase